MFNLFFTHSLKKFENKNYFKMNEIQIKQTPLFVSYANFLYSFIFFSGVMDESGEQFVAYFLPMDDTMEKRRKDFTNEILYEDDEEYEYKMAREYNWNVKSKASKGYEENYFFVLRNDGVYYDELETRVRLSKRRQKAGQAPSNTKYKKFLLFSKKSFSKSSFFCFPDL